ncbi:hypothetical protein WN943_006428 [Citrus x changshan-huyou]
MGLSPGQLDSNGWRVLGGSCKGWKNQYFVVGGNWGRYVELTKGWFKVPTHFSRPGNMSTAKHTPTEIAKALIEEISDEEGEPHTKVTELATLVPSAFYHIPLPRYVQNEAYLKDTLEKFSHFLTTHSLEALARNQAEAASFDNGRAYRDVFKVIERL